MDGRTDSERCKVACPRLKIDFNHSPVAAIVSSVAEPPSWDALHVVASELPRQVAFDAAANLHRFVGVVVAIVVAVASIRFRNANLKFVFFLMDWF